MPSGSTVGEVEVINAAIKSMFVGRCEQSDYVKTIVVLTAESYVRLRPSTSHS